MSEHPHWLSDVESTADEIIRRVGKDLRVGMPLGLGKPVELINALYRRAKNDPEIRLTILTALTLEKPVETDPYRKRLLEPVFERVFGNTPDADYAVDLSNEALPENVTVKEFFFRPGSRLGNSHAQRHYVSSNYTHAARDVFAQGCNVAMQLVARGEDADGDTRLSMSCNPDTSPELAEMLAESGRTHVTVAVVNRNLPFMYGDADVPPDHYHLVLEEPGEHYDLFPMPRLLPVGTPDYVVGLLASALVPDGGSLQVGIGALGDAIVYGLRLRERDNATYQALLREAGVLPRYQALIDAIGGVTPFDEGLYGATEMFVEGFMHLIEAGVLKREVYGFWGLQTLINQGRCNPQRLVPDVLDALESLGVRVIRTKDFEILQHHGFFNDATGYDQGYLIAPDGTRVIANVADPEARRIMGAQCLGERLRNGVILQGGFFLGSDEFYRALREMPAERRRKIDMTGVYKINQLDHNPRLYKAQRHDARFINTGIMATLSGAVVSDGLENGQVISGVGGQYNFVAMAHQLPGGRSILMVRTVREKHGKASSNIVLNYGHCTIPRHLRDIVITEYGIADLRSKSDADVIKELLNVADSRFQQSLLEEAKAAGKIERDYEIPEDYRHNTPERLENALGDARARGLFPAFPFGSDFTDDELALGRALRGLAERREQGILMNLWAARKVKAIPEAARPYLERMGLAEPSGLREKMAQRLLVLELEGIGAIRT